MLLLTDVTLQYRHLIGRQRAVLEGLHLQINPGEVHAIVGRNGAGKTTLVRAILGLLRPVAGEVRVMGVVPHQRPRHVRARIGAFLDGQRQFSPRWTGPEGLEYVGVLNGLSSAEIRKRSRELLERVGLADAATQRINTYSRGMRQRLGLAATFMNDPDLFIWDEPSLGLDVEGGRLLRELIEEAKGRNAAMLLTSHEVGLLEHAADRITVIDSGRVVTSGTPEEIAAHAKDAARVRLTLDRAPEGLPLPPGVVVEGRSVECPLHMPTLHAVFVAAIAAGHELCQLRSDSTLEESLIRLGRQEAS